MSVRTALTVDGQGLAPSLLIVFLWADRKWPGK